MNPTRDPEAILATWLDEGPIDLPDATRRAILGALPTTPQARRGPLAPRRSIPMPAFSRLAAAAIVAVVAVGAFLYMAGPRSSVGGPSPSPAASPSSAPSGRATSTAPPIDTSAWIQYSSVYGYDARYPKGWTATFGSGAETLVDLHGDTVHADHFTSPGLGIGSLSGTSMRLPDGMTEDAWLAAYRGPIASQFGESCFPTRDQWLPISLDGHPGGLYVGCNYVESMTFVGGRAYIFTYSGLSGAGADAEAMLRALLSTVRLRLDRVPEGTPGPS